MNNTQILNLLIRLANNAETWRKEWVEHGDVPALRNYTFALGKINGVETVAYQLDIEIPEALTARIKTFSDDWASGFLTIKKAT